MSNIGGLDVVIDTNMLIHFRRFDEIDWCAWADVPAVTLLVTPILMRELETLKVTHKMAKLRDRAAKAVANLAEKIDLPDPIAIRPNVTLEFIEHEPRVDFAAERLSFNIADDQFIAAALDRAESTARTVAIASGDSGLAMKLRSRAIRLLKPDDTLRLPAAADEAEREVGRLKREIESLKSRAPKLRVAFEGETPDNILAIPSRATRIPEDFETVARRHPTYEYRPPASDGGIQVYSPPTSAMIARYETARQTFLDDYRAYLIAHEAWREEVTRCFSIGFQLENEGNAPATDIDVHLDFPDDVELLARMPAEPRAPVAPKAPQTRMDDISPYRDFDGVQPDTRARAGETDDEDGVPDFAERSSYLSYAVGHLKHLYVRELKPVIMLIPLSYAGGGFPIEVEASCNETDRVESTLNVTVEQRNSDLAA